MSLFASPSCTNRKKAFGFVQTRVSKKEYSTVFGGLRDIRVKVNNSAIQEVQYQG